MLRRFILWTAVLFVMLGGVLTGHRSTAQGEDAQVWMVIYERHNRQPHIMVQDPASGKTRSLSRQELLQHLQDGSLKYDLSDDLYKWGGVWGDPLPYSVFLEQALAWDYLGDLSMQSWAQPSPDWQWIVYQDFENLYSINLNMNERLDLLASTNLHAYDLGFGLVFAPDGETFFYQAYDYDGNRGLHRLRLDGQNPQVSAPIVTGDFYPLTWLEGTDWLILEKEGHLWRMHDDGSDLEELYPEKSGWQFFINWIPTHHILMMSATERGSIGLIIDDSIDVAWEGSDPLERHLFSDALYELSLRHGPFEEISKTDDANWIAAANEFELFLIDAATREVTPLFTEPNHRVFLSQNSFSPNGEWLVYWTRPTGSDERTLHILSQSRVTSLYDWPMAGGFIAWLVLEDTP